MQLTPGFTRKPYDHGGNIMIASHPNLPEEGSAGTSSAKSLHELGLRHLYRQAGQNHIRQQRQSMDNAKPINSRQDVAPSPLMRREQEVFPQPNVPYGRKGYLPLQFMIKAVPKHIEEVDITAKMKQIKQIMSPASQTAAQSGKPLFSS